MTRRRMKPKSSAPDSCKFSIALSFYTASGDTHVQDHCILTAWRPAYIFITQLCVLGFRVIGAYLWCLRWRCYLELTKMLASWCTSSSSGKGSRERRIAFSLYFSIALSLWGDFFFPFWNEYGGLVTVTR